MRDLYDRVSSRFRAIMGQSGTSWDPHHEQNFIQRLVHLILHASNALSTIAATDYDGSQSLAGAAVISRLLLWNSWSNKGFRV